MSGCMICGRPVAPFISFGRMPLANGFLGPEEFSTEFFFELKAGFCEPCALVQLVDRVPSERMFHDRYPFFTATSARMVAHFRKLAESVRRDRMLSRDPFVVEIGSNDGTMLETFASAGLRHLGVEPSANVAVEAERRGVRTLRRFFDEETARDIVREHGQADAIAAANCFCHIPDLRSLAAGVALLLKPEGALIFEDPYLGDIVAKASYDQIYDEHASYFSVLSVERWLAPHGLRVVDVEPLPVHGGSMRYVIRKAGAQEPAPEVEAARAAERRMGLDRPETFAGLARRVEASREALRALLRKLKREGRRVVGYGATSKSTTVTNYCGLTPELVEFISDTTPIKQGKFSPGAHIPVRPHGDFQARYPDYALLFAWNHAEEIMEKEQAFGKAGGRWIVYVPEVGLR